MIANVSPIEWSRWTPSDDPERVTTGEPIDPWSHGDGAGADHEFVVADRLFASCDVGYEQLAAITIDSACDRVQVQPHPGRLEVGNGPVSEVSPVRDVP